jgi:exodeoxyribonuclease-5
MEDFEPNPQQAEAIAEAVEWYKGWSLAKHKKQVFFLAGFAGTGKTSVAKTIAELCVPANRIAYIAPTGKAASRLKAKGCEGAMTLHGFVYNYRGNNEEKEPIFHAKDTLDAAPLLVVMDESSMVGDFHNRDLLKHGIAVLALGDIGQLPPVKAAAVYTEGSQDFLLTDIMRQEAESNIVRASMFVRSGKRLPVREYDDVRVRAGVISDDVLMEHLVGDSQVLCSKNRTREAFNERARKMLGFSGHMPMVGEKLVCTFNQHRYGFMNGEQGIVLGFKNNDPETMEKCEALQKERMELKAAADEATEACDWDEVRAVREDLKDIDKEIAELEMKVVLRSLTDNSERAIAFNPLCFDKEPETREEYRKSIGGFDFGYALTVHKSQGSEWSKVLVMEEILPSTPYNKLMYTAVTRAIDQLTIYRA